MGEVRRNNYIPRISHYVESQKVDVPSEIDIGVGISPKIKRRRSLQRDDITVEQIFVVVMCDLQPGHRADVVYNSRDPACATFVMAEKGSDLRRGHSSILSTSVWHGTIDTRPQSR
jgi:hypothetical protein